MDDDIVGPICALGLFALVITMIAVVVDGCSTKAARHEAIKAGVGEYFINEKQDKEFRWKKATP